MRLALVHNRGVGYDLVVHRARAFMLKRRTFHVEIDGVVVGTLKPGGKVTVELREGVHEVRVVAGPVGSQTLTVHAQADGSRSLVARPADVDPASKTARMARRDPYALILTEGSDVSRIGPTFRQTYSSRTRSFGNPARTRAQRFLWNLGLIVGVAGFVLLPLVRNGIGFVFLIVCVLIIGSLQVRYLFERHLAAKKG